MCTFHSLGFSKFVIFPSTLTFTLTIDSLFRTFAFTCTLIVFEAFTITLTYTHLYWAETFKTLLMDYNPKLNSERLESMQ